MIRQTRTRFAHFALWPLAFAAAHADPVAHYLANEGVMVQSGETKILFDPLFDEDYGVYQTLPDPMKATLMRGDAPYDGVDAMFISHYHDDHFSPLEVLEYLKAHPDVRLFAPAQATRVVLSLAGESSDGLDERITPIDIAYGDPAVEFALDSLVVEAFHIPHSGWPQSRTEVHNIAFRVTLDDAVTVLHMGDADTRTVHLDHDAARWSERDTHLAMPPYWFFLSEDGREVIDERIAPGISIGIHVPERLDAPTTEALDGRDLFRKPGETRLIPVAR